ncbi:uncharacterized protein LOC131598551 [Vicia villosa]|uniref:uncharacterized protein LOC131598551 n=1 Tax=Vicia villosa TaxID=3911 RepID=UPI00273CBC72|nr:uncharacterized protein LOC131598551 [Vicia villosa]
MRRFLVDRENIQNVNVVQSEVKLEPPLNNVVNEFNPNEIVRDPGYREQISEYAPDIQDQVRRAYILKGPMQPDLSSFPRTQFGSQPGRAEHFGFEVFTESGYKDWNHASQGLKGHVGSYNSLHNSCVKHYDDYNNQRQRMTSKFAKATKESEELYKIHLTCSLDCSRYLIAQGMAFRGHDESSTSLNKGNFREMVDWVKSQNEQVRDAFDRGRKNCTMTYGDIQKELAMFVNDKGNVVERFIALHHVTDTSSKSLKDALYGILDKYTLSISRIRGQGYDGASNMRGEFNGLQRKILEKFYVHCYAHRLQLVVVSVTCSCSSIHDFFEYIALIVNTTSASCKRMDALTKAQHQYILNKLESCEISRGRGLHQSSSLTRPGDTRWGSHHTTLLRLDQMWSSVLKVLTMVDEDGRGPSQAACLIEKMESF